MPPDTLSPHCIHAQRLCAPTCQRLCLVGRISSLFSSRDVWNNLWATVQLKAHGTQTTRNRDTRRHPEGKKDPQRDVAGAPEEWKMVTFICRGQEGIRKKSEIKMDSGSREGVLRAASLTSTPPPVCKWDWKLACASRDVRFTVWAHWTAAGWINLPIQCSNCWYFYHITDDQARLLFFTAFCASAFYT